jgi:DNA-directed RNA polymerase subunit RPC12/RpoP
MGWSRETPRRFDPADYIRDDVRCPACGCRDVEIITWPTIPNGRPLGWFERQGAGGEAECRYCGAVFPVRLVEEDAPHNPGYPFLLAADRRRRDVL